jgi:hypothetical protein
MHYKEDSPIALSCFFEEWAHYAAINSLGVRPASERFQAFKAAWTLYDAAAAGSVDTVLTDVPPEYQMLKDWLAAESSGFWEPVARG